jgi:hypothetical protein
MRPQHAHKKRDPRIPQVPLENNVRPRMAFVQPHRCDHRYNTGKIMLESGESVVKKVSPLELTRVSGRASVIQTCR